MVQDNTRHTFHIRMQSAGAHADTFALLTGLSVQGYGSCTPPLRSALGHLEVHRCALSIKLLCAL